MEDYRFHKCILEYKAIWRRERGKTEEEMERYLKWNRPEGLCLQLMMMTNVTERSVQWFSVTIVVLLTDTIIPLLIAQNPAADACALFAVNCLMNIWT
jgi:hypothetical protein